MSFKCQNCNSQQPAKTSPIMAVAKKRNRYYPEVRNRDNEIVESAGRGWEIVEEKACCPACAPKVESRCR
jgi:hypothetical protein